MGFTRDDITAKIKKLLKLAESSNVNEAAAAAAKAQELMDRFEIEAAVLAETTPDTAPAEPVETFGDFDSGGRVESWRSALLHALCMANACKAYRYRARAIRQTSLKVIGRRTDVQTVRYMYQAMVSLVEGLADAQRGRGRGFIASFKMGAAHAICARIKESKEETRRAVYQEAAQAGTQALMRVDNAMSVLKERQDAIQRYMASTNLRLKNGAASRVGNSSGYSQGYAAGKAANIGGSARPLPAGKQALAG